MLLPNFELWRSWCSELCSGILDNGDGLFEVFLPGLVDSRSKRDTHQARLRFLSEWQLGSSVLAEAELGLRPDLSY